MISFSPMYCHSWQGSQEPFFQQDNARPHIARVSQDFLCDVTFFPGLLDSQICLQLRISKIIWDGKLGSLPVWSTYRRVYCNCGIITDDTKEAPCRTVGAKSSRWCDAEDWRTGSQLMSHIHHLTVTVIQIPRSVIKMHHGAFKFNVNKQSSNQIPPHNR
ncbi:hypothetical protein TNCV_3009201 [Trichonephila clavipes]|nr:hypothetical protein TNCV_3009201 [Trichonephila clavipes]